MVFNNETNNKIKNLKTQKTANIPDKENPKSTNKKSNEIKEKICTCWSTYQMKEKENNCTCLSEEVGNEVEVNLWEQMNCTW